MKPALKILIFSLLVLSCQNANNKDENQIITFDLKELPELSTVKLSDLGFVDIEYIPLETNDQSVISNTSGITTNFGPYRIIACDGGYLFYFWSTLLMFRDDGSFITRIGIKGRGPNEYLSVHDVDIDLKDEYVYLVDASQDKFIVYSKKGDFIRRFQIPLHGAMIAFRIIDNNILCYSDNHLGIVENSFTLIDTSGKIIKNYPNRYPAIKGNKSTFGFAHENLFYSFNDHLFKKEVFSDTVFVFENMEFRPHLIINVGERLITQKARSEFDGLYLMKNFINPLNLFEFGDYIFYGYIYGAVPFEDEKAYGFIGSKKDKSQVFINLNKGIVNDLDGGPNILPITIRDDNTVISLVDALTLKTYVESVDFKNSMPKYPDKKNELERLAKKLKETDNPVLILLKLEGR